MVETIILVRINVAGFIIVQIFGTSSRNLLEIFENVWKSIEIFNLWIWFLQVKQGVFVDCLRTVNIFQLNSQWNLLGWINSWCPLHFILTDGNSVETKWRRTKENPAVFSFFTIKLYSLQAKIFSRIFLPDWPLMSCSPIAFYRIFS